MPDIYLSIDGQQHGPYTEEQLRQSLAEGQIPADLPAWHEGLEDWVQVGSLATLDDEAMHTMKFNKAVSPVPINTESPEIVTASNISDSVKPSGMHSRMKTRNATYLYVAISTTIIAMLAFIAFSLNTFLTSKSSYNNVTNNQETENSNIAHENSVSNNQNEENSNITPDEAENWVTEKIEQFGGEKFTYPDGEVETTLYRNVRFDGDILSIDVQIQNSGDNMNYEENINLAGIRPSSFKCASLDRTDEKVGAYDPSILYIIEWTKSGNEPANYSENPHFTAFQLEIKDEQIAERIAKALNFISKQTKPEPF